MAAGGVLEILVGFKFKASVASFNAEIPPSRLFAGRWDSAFMDKTRGGYRGTVWLEGRGEGSKL